MPLNLKHEVWEPTGRKFEVLDQQGQSYSPKRYCWSGGIGEQQIYDGQDWQAYIYNSETNELRYAKDDIRLEMADAQQVIKKSGEVLCSSLKFFVQQETSPDVWETVSHGMPTREIRHNKQFIKSGLVDAEGYCVGWLSFPAAPYDLQIGMQVGRSNKATFGFRFRSPIGGRVRFQIVKDGFRGRPGGYELIKMGGGGKGRGERIVGIRHKDTVWRWTYDEAAYHTVSVENSIDYPGDKRAIITVGPFDYTANEWLEIVPLTWGLSGETDNDHVNLNNHFYAEYNSKIYIGNSYYDASGGFTFDNVTVPAGATIDSGTYIQLVRAGSSGAGANGVLKCVDNADTSAPRTITTWSESYRVETPPPLHATTHAEALGTGSTGAVNFGDGASELNSVIQDRFDDANGHESGDSIAIIIDNNGSGDWSAFESATSGTGAKLYIVYTEAAGRRVILSKLLDKTTKLFSLAPFAYVGAALFRNPKLKRRQFFNFLNWIKR